MRTSLFFTALLFTTPAQAEILNLSCDDGGMLLLIDTDKATVTDRNPFQKAEVTVPLVITEAAFTWQEKAGDTTANYALDRITRRVSVTANGEAVPLSNPQCGKSARLLPR
jgi:endo-1,4-beta-D-glucanase Y